MTEQKLKVVTALRNIVNFDQLLWITIEGMSLISAFHISELGHILLRGIALEIHDRLSWMPVRLWA